MAIHRMIDFLRAGEIQVNPELGSRSVFPFTEGLAIKFFHNFSDRTFEFDGIARFIFIYDGKYNLPGHSFASAWLFKENYDEFMNAPEMPKPVGAIQFEFGGNRTTPHINARKI